ncbi:MAG TPA: GNAT family N-acetyltransferase [Chloroflexia bacterium]|jgi:CelD/BcsL family acetyltransferase involved in cellulose biosynthesis
MITMERPLTLADNLVDELARSALAASPQALHIETVRDVLAFAALRREWGELLDESRAGIFNSWEWLYPWYRRLGQERELHILAAREQGGRLVGLMPLCLEHRRAMGRKLRRLTFLGETEVCGDYMDVVSLPELHGAVVEAFAAHLRQSQSEWDVLDLADIDSQSPTLEMLRQSFAAPEYVAEVRPGSMCPSMSFEPGETFEGFLKGSSRRENYRRRKKQLEKQPGFSVECIEDPAQLARPFSEFLRLHSLRWSGDGGSDGISGHEVEAFHRDAAALLAERGKLRLFVLLVGGKAVASLYALRHGDTFSYYQAGRDPEWQSMSVGLVMLVETFKRAIEEGASTYDFLRGEEPYKADWNNGRRHTVGLRVYPRGGTGARLGRQERLVASSRGLAKRLLPGSLLERVRRVRKVLTG